MDAAQIDQTLENLLTELQKFKRVSQSLTDTNIKAEEVIAAGKTVVTLSNRITRDSQVQLETVRDYALTSERRLTELSKNVTDEEKQQREALLAFQRSMQSQIDTLISNITTAQKRQDRALNELKELINDVYNEQRKTQERLKRFTALVIIIPILASIFLGVFLSAIGI